MSINKLKMLSLVFFVLMLIGLVYSAYLFTVLQEKNQKINNLYKKQKLIELQLEEALKGNTNVEGSNENTKTYKAESITKIKNSIYKFGLYSVGQKRKIQVAEKYLKSQNYKIIDQRTYETMPSWYSRNGPTIFYYTKGNLELARKIKKDLDELLGMKFRIQVGAGTGVSAEDRPIKMMIHLG